MSLTSVWDQPKNSFYNLMSPLLFISVKKNKIVLGSAQLYLSLNRNNRNSHLNSKRQNDSSQYLWGQPRNDVLTDVPIN